MRYKTITVKCWPINIYYWLWPFKFRFICIYIYIRKHTLTSTEISIRKVKLFIIRIILHNIRNSCITGKSVVQKTVGKSPSVRGRFWNNRRSCYSLIPVRCKRISDKRTAPPRPPPAPLARPSGKYSKPPTSRSNGTGRRSSRAPGPVHQPVNRERKVFTGRPSRPVTVLRGPTPATEEAADRGHRRRTEALRTSNRRPIVHIRRRPPSVRPRPRARRARRRVRRIFWNWTHRNAR